MSTTNIFEKHVSETPSAMEIEKDGINVSELNMAMLKKIEELTPYTIQLRKKSKY